jgi:hypothetical protein
MCFGRERRRASLHVDRKDVSIVPYSLAQWTGIAVTVIVVAGSDMDVIYAVPLGIFAGALATFFSVLAERYRPQPQSAAPVKTGAAAAAVQPASAGMVLSDSSSSKKLG